MTMKTLIRVTMYIEFAFSLVVFVVGFYSLFTGVKLWWIASGLGAITAFTGLMVFLTYRTNGRLKNRGM